jgi:hypothetical protein
MDENESVYEVHTPTRSELATFQVLANQDFVNLQRMPEAVEEDIPESVSVRVFEEDADLEAANLYESLPQPTQENFSHQVDEKIDEGHDAVEYEEAATNPAFASPAEPSAKEWKPPSPRIPSPPQIHTPKSSFRPSKSEKSSRYKDATKAEIEAEKEGLLSELHNLERQGLTKLVRPLSMDDSLEEIQFQYDRIQAELNANQMVDFAKSSIKMGSGMAEMLMKKAGIKVVDGYHNNLCKDMNKFNRPLNRLYKKYWRRGGMSPEAELGMLVLGSLAWTVVQNKMGSATAAFTGTPSEVPPPPAAPSAEKVPASASPRPMMRPPQMSSLNVPTSWSSPVLPTAQAAAAPNAAVGKDEGAEKRTQEMLRLAEERLKSIESARADIDSKYAIMQQISDSLEKKTAILDRRSAEMDARESALNSLSSFREEESSANTLSSNGEDSTKPRRVIVSQTSATPKKSAKKIKNVAIDI